MSDGASVCWQQRLLASYGRATLGHRRVHVALLVCVVLVTMLPHAEQFVRAELVYFEQILGQFERPL